MTDEEFEAASKAYYKWRKALSEPPNEVETYEAAFSAALEFKRAENEQYRLHGATAAGRVQHAYIKAMEIERARSAKLIHMLESIDRRAGSASKQSGWTDAIEVAEWARKALAEYEADHD